MSIEIQISMSEECRAVAAQKFSGPGAKERFQVEIRKAIAAARERLTK